LSQFGMPPRSVLLKPKCFAAGRAMFEHSGQIGAATLAIVSMPTSSDAANRHKLGRKPLMVSPIQHRAADPLPLTV
jgi:hypothetical protein